MKSRYVMSCFKTFKNNTAVATACILSALVFLPSVNALEFGGELHKGSESGLSAISIHTSDTFTKGGSLYWSASYNYLNGLSVDWNDSELEFNTSTIDATVFYRQKLKSYSKFWQKVTIDYQAGISVNLTENKFTWPELNEEKQFSNKNDINAVIAVSANYKVNKSTSVHVGIKHLPSFSDFESISTVYAGFTYRFVNAFGY